MLSSTAVGSPPAGFAGASGASSPPAISAPTASMPASPPGGFLGPGAMLSENAIVDPLRRAVQQKLLDEKLRRAFVAARELREGERRCVVGRHRDVLQKHSRDLGGEAAVADRAE